MSTRLEKYWAGMVQRLCSEPAQGHIQIRKFTFNLSWTVPWDVFKTGVSMDFSDFGYKEGGSKEEQLTRVYLNDEEIRRTNQKFRERSESETSRSMQTCVTARFGNQEKEARSQGYCMQSVTMNWFARPALQKDPLFTLDLHYRTTELCKKFYADLKFLHETVFPKLLKGVKQSPTAVNFHFVSAYVSTMYLPVVLRVINPLDFLKSVERFDPKFFKLMLRDYDLWLFTEGNPYNYRQRKNMLDYGKKHIITQLKPDELRELKSIVRKHRPSKEK